MAGLRIIGGQFRGRRLTYHGDPLTRPMKDRVREAVFNLLWPGAEGAVAIDLFAGTGALGLEALSRGAVAAWLAPAALRAEPRERVVLLEPVEIDEVFVEVLSRVRGELSAAGYEVIVLRAAPDVEPKVAVETAGSELSPVAVLLVHRDSGDDSVSRVTELWVSDRLSNRTSVQRIKVDDAAVGFAKTGEQIALLAGAVKAAQRSLAISTLQYREGLVDFQRVLDSQRTLFTQQDLLVSTRGNQTQSLVALFKAMGGGWEPARGRPPVVTDVRQSPDRTAWPARPPRPLRRDPPAARWPARPP